MNISLITLFPDLYQPFLASSLIKKAREKELIRTDVYNLFSYADAKERIDGPTFGHGAGMVIRPEVVERAVTAVEAVKGPAFKIFFSPRGKKLDQALLRELMRSIQEKQSMHLMVLPARYEGMDARIEAEYADAIISVGDFVLMGGDLPAMIFLEGFLRLVPGVVGKAESVEADSFTGPFVDYPEYTVPVEWKDHVVPEVLRSGNHKAIADWRQNQAVYDSVRNHFGWVRSYPVITPEQQKAIVKQIPPHYAVLMHCDVLLPQSPPVHPELVEGSKGGLKPGNTSVTSLDMHDIARSAATYGIKNYFLVTPLEDQQAIVKTLLGFWQQGPGVTYNNHRHEAVNRVILESSLDAVIETIIRNEGKPPILIATAARPDSHEKLITFADQQKVWAHDRPVLIIFGTGHGLSPDLMARCDYRLVPLEGFTDFNHLSVRSAAAVIFDRWLGKNPARLGMTA